MDKQREFTLKMVDRVMEMVTAISLQLNKDTNGVEINSLEGVIAILHKRVHSNLISIRYFVLDEKNLSPTAPMILFRAIALDYMILVYLNMIKKELEGDSYKWRSPISEGFQKELDVLLNDQLVRLYKDGYDLIEVEFENVAEYEAWVIKIRKLLPPRYHYIDKDTKGFRFHAPTTLFKILKDKLPKDDFNKSIKRIWSFYSSYSKIDHFGLMSIVLERRPVDEFIKELRFGLLYIVNALELVGVDFMQVETFRQMLAQLDTDLENMGEP